MVAERIDDAVMADPFDARPVLSALSRVADPTDDASALTIFLSEIDKGPLLTADQEKALGWRVHGHDVHVPPPGNPYPTVAEALDRLVESNLRLTVSMSKRFRGRGAQMDDLIQEGAIGLRTAAEKFDPAKGFRFSTYATWWIRQAMQRYVADHGRSIRLPVHVHDRMRAYNRATSDLMQRFRRHATTAELLAELQHVQPGSGWTLRWVMAIAEAGQQVASLDAPVARDTTDGGETTLGDFLADPEPIPETVALDVDLQEVVRARLGGLNPRQRTVVSMRFGLGQDRASTLEEAGMAIGVTRERARQIEADGLKILFKDPVLRQLAASLR